jgi:hypothetical protein
MMPIEQWNANVVSLPMHDISFNLFAKFAASSARSVAAPVTTF